MFNLTDNFNGDISGWDVSSVTTMSSVFSGAALFNQDISAWDVSSVAYMAAMFKDATNFDQDLSNWCVTNITSLPNNFYANSGLQRITYLIGAVVLLANNTWKGTTNNNWNTTSNWSTSSVPTASQNITIPSGLTNYPTTSSAVSFNTMTLRNGATFISESTVNGSNNITYKKRLPNTDWYLISSPVSGESMEDVISNHSLATGTGTNVGLASFVNTDSNPWNYKSATSTGDIK